MSEDERAIRNLIATWIAASKSGDTATVLSLMADDVLFLVPGHRPFGKDAFAAASEQMKNMSFEGESEVEEIEICGDRAWCRTHLRVTMVPPGGRAERRSGYTLSILRKKPSGQWVLFRDANLLVPEPDRPVPIPTG